MELETLKIKYEELEKKIARIMATSAFPEMYNDMNEAKYYRDKAEQNLAVAVSAYDELHTFISKHLSDGMIATERDGKDFDWYAPMQDGMMASFRDLMSDIKSKIKGSE